MENLFNLKLEGSDLCNEAVTRSGKMVFKLGGNPLELEGGGGLKTFGKPFGI